MNKTTEEFSAFTGKNKGTSDNIKSLMTDAKHNLWVSTFRGGIDLYDSNRRKVANYEHSKSNPGSLLVNDVRKTVLEGDSGLWVAYQYPTPEVSYFSFRDKSFTHSDWTAYAIMITCLISCVKEKKLMGYQQ